MDLKKRNINILKIVKIAAGTAISIVIAERMGLNYSASAGVITLLSIHDTKKETVRVTLRRFLSFFVSLLLAAVCFHLFGYHAYSIALFLLLFAAFCIRFQTQEGLSVNTVLMTHFYGERSMAPEQVLNEFLLLLVGAGIGVLLNLYIPSRKKQIISMQRQIEERMKLILAHISDALYGLNPGCNQHGNLSRLEKELENGERSAYMDMENTLLSETGYYIRYMNLRQTQAVVLDRIERNVCRLQFLPPQAQMIAGLMDHISTGFHEYNNALSLLEELENLKKDMGEQPMPRERPEFENRAVLYSILLELEQLLILKKKFVDDLSPEEIRKFWNGEES